VSTPARAATLYEYNQKGRVPTETTIDNPISLSIRKLNASKIEQILKENGAFHKLFTNIRAADNMMRYSTFRAHILDITSTPIIDENKKQIGPSGIEFLQRNEKLRERFLRFIIKMQIDLGLEVVTIPYLNLPFTDYKSLIKDVTNGLRTNNLEPFLIFDLDYNEGHNFEDVISFLLKDIGIKLLGFRNKSFARNAVSYDILSKYVDHDIALFSYDVERADIYNSQISTMHYLPFFGEDIYAVKSPRYKPKDNKNTHLPKAVEKEVIKIFEPNTLLIRPASERIQSSKEILKEMDQSMNSRLSALLVEYEKRV
jgi:hypothetical protein